jgi:5,10-methylenetetrahydrofolate reductase
MTFLSDGKTTFGTEVAGRFRRLEEAGADILGLNCTIGPQETLEVFQRVVSQTSLPVSVMPNAGYPWIVSGRTVYPATPDYFREVARDFVKAGAAIVGGCCGTTPAHIAAMAREVVGKRRTEVARVARAFVTAPAAPATEALETSVLKRKLADPKALVVTVEIEPPKGTDCSAALDGAQLLRSYGVDAVNVTDNPMARLRMSSIAVAHMIRHETGVDTVFHFSPRDRNVLGIQSDLLGAAGLGIKALLVVGGDPLKIGDYPQGRHVGEVDTLGLLRIVKGLNRRRPGGRPDRDVHLVRHRLRREPGRARPRRRDLEALAKIEAGATFAQTQPVYDVAALDRFFARPEARLIPVLVGLIPPKSLKQALYFANEVPGMVVPEAILARMRKAAEKGPEFEAEEGLAIGIELAAAIAERARGIHLMPMARYEVVRRVLEALPGRDAEARPPPPRGTPLRRTPPEARIEARRAPAPRARRGARSPDRRPGRRNGDDDPALPPR